LAIEKYERKKERKKKKSFLKWGGGKDNNFQTTIEFVIFLPKFSYK